MIPIYKKEIRAYFTQMIGYVFLTFLLFPTGLYFMVANVFSMSPNYYDVLSGTTLLFFILMPTLTMRMFAEEVRHKTDQLLYTSPLSVASIVAGKFLAALTIFLFGMGITLLFPFMLSNYGALPTAQIACAYLGYILMGASFISVGLFISVLTDNQIISAVVTFSTLFAMFIMDGISGYMPTNTAMSMIFVAILIIIVAAIWFNSTRNIYASIIIGAVGVMIAALLFSFNNLIYDGIIVKVLQWFSVYGRFANMLKGILNLSDIVYYISFSLVFIYLTVNVIEKRRWR